MPDNIPYINTALSVIIAVISPFVPDYFTKGLQCSDKSADVWGLPSSSAGHPGCLSSWQQKCKFETHTRKQACAGTVPHVIHTTFSMTLQEWMTFLEMITDTVLLLLYVTLLRLSGVSFPMCYHGAHCLANQALRLFLSWGFWACFIPLGWGWAVG